MEKVIITLSILFFALCLLRVIMAGLEVLNKEEVAKAKEWYNKIDINRIREAGYEVGVNDTREEFKQAFAQALDMAINKYKEETQGQHPIMGHKLELDITDAPAEQFTARPIKPIDIRIRVNGYTKSI